MTSTPDDVRMLYGTPKLIASLEDAANALTIEQRRGLDDAIDDHESALVVLTLALAHADAANLTEASHRLSKLIGYAESDLADLQEERRS